MTAETVIQHQGRARRTRADTPSSGERASPQQRSPRVPKADRLRSRATNVHLCIPDDQLVHFPNGHTMPTWPQSAPTPRVGEVIYLTSTSAWAVSAIIHEIVHGGEVRVEVWLVWIGSARFARESGFESTH